MREQAERDVRLARLIGPAPATDSTGEVTVGAATGAALAEGRLRVEQAACIVTALQELPTDGSDEVRSAVEDTMLGQAGDHDPAVLTRLGHRILEHVTITAADRRLAKQLEREEHEASRRRSATRYADGHGGVCYRLRVPVSDAAIIDPVLDAPSQPSPATGGVRDERTADQRRADAFVETFRRVSLDGGLPTNGADRPRVVLTMCLDDLLNQTGAATLTDTGEQLPPSVARRLARDAQLIPAVLDRAGQILDLGHARRTFDGHARLAVALRDHGCVHPGCDRPPRWCDAHHLIPGWDGGPTDRSNGVLLCGFHHRLYHHSEWRIRFADDGIPETIPPT